VKHRIVYQRGLYDKTETLSKCESTNHPSTADTMRKNQNHNGPGKLTVKDITSMKMKQEKICVLTSYDYCFASICDSEGIDILLVGDSGGMVMLGYESTIPVSMQEMMVFSKAVAKATKRALIVGDMPFGSYQISVQNAIKNSISLIKSGCDAVKLEGGIEIVDTVKAMTSVGVPVMGHIGLKPQTAKLWEGYRIQGKTAESALKLISDANALEQAGVFGLVLEMVTDEVAEIITRNLSIPTIGIGSGSSCDGQVLVLHDMLGIYKNINPKFVKHYAELSGTISNAVTKYIQEVKSSVFPATVHSFHMDRSGFDQLHDSLIGKREEKTKGKKKMLTKTRNGVDPLAGKQ
jgi:3-methyl-2-oxobutanoate hydroxymethyltransferase